MKTKMRSTVLALAAFGLALAVRADNPCPCPGDQPYAGQDACGNDVCDPAMVGEYPYTDACGTGTCDAAMDGEYPIDCDGDGIGDVCLPEDCCSVMGISMDPDLVCCGDEEYDPSFISEATLVELNIATIIAVYSDAKDILNSIGPCTDSGGAAPNVGITSAWFEDCCDGELKELNKFGGILSWDAGTTTCDWPLVGVPYLASVNATANAGFNFSISPNKSESCDGDELCFTGNSAFGLGGGVSATAAAGVIRFSATLQTDASAHVEWCTDSGFAGTEVCIGSIKVVGTATLASLLEKDIDFSVYEGDCS